MKSFEGRVAALTGAGSGIGRELSRELARRGCHLALSDLNLDGAEETRRLIAASGASVSVTCRRVDTASRADVAEWASETVRQHGRVNLLFNNAGVALAAPLETVKQRDFEWIMNINFWGVVWGCQEFLPLLKQSGEGHLINISSLFGLLSTPYNGPYNASKFAVRGYTEALRMELELEQACVSVTCVHPGGIRTQIAKAARVDETLAAHTGVDEKSSRERFERLLGRTSPQEAARAILGAVQRNARRVLVGADAHVLDLLVRLTGSGYQRVMLRAAGAGK